MRREQTRPAARVRPAGRPAAAALRPVCACSSAAGPARAFTLIELLLVLALLATVVGSAAPTLARFFRGRNLDSEAQRFLALTRYGQSRAITEGIPTVLWVDAEAGTYGLETEATYSTEDRKAIQYELSEDVEVEVEQPLGASRNQLPKSTQQIAANLPVIRFTPDGTLADTSPEYVLFREAREGGTGELWVSQTRNRLGYEIRTNAPYILRGR